MTRGLVLFLIFLAIASARVTFDHAEVLDHNDLTAGEKKSPFVCPAACRVYTPTTKALKIINDQGKDIITFAALHSRPIDQPFELTAGTYFVVDDHSDSSPDFTLYVVQKGAANYNTRVYTSPQQKADATNERFVTILADAAGLRISELDGDFGAANPAVYATGFDSVAKCRPVFASRSADNARLTSVVVFGPIATVDFGSDKGAHFLTIGYDYLSKPTTQLGSSTVLVSPGYVGCPDNQVFTNIQINELNQAPYTISSPKGVSLKLVADYSLITGISSVQIKISDETIRLTGTDTLTKYVDAKSLTVSVNWTRGVGDYLSHFAIQIDNFENNGTPHGPDSTGSGSTPGTDVDWTTSLCSSNFGIFLFALLSPMDRRNPQGQNNVGAVLAKANALAGQPQANRNGPLRLSPADAIRVATLTGEIETLQAINTPQSRARQQVLSDERAQIFYAALAQQNTNRVRLSPADAERVARITNEIETLQLVDAPHARALEQSLSDEREQIFRDAMAQQAQQAQNANN